MARTFLAATIPPPTASTGRFLSWIKSGNCCIPLA